MVSHLLLAFSAIIFSAFSPVGAEDLSAKCLALKSNLQLENTTILDVSYIAAPTNVSTAGSCQSSAPVTAAPLCRVYFVINTTDTSAVHAEAWLPDTWFGRFLGLGNGGLNGCASVSSSLVHQSLSFFLISLAQASNTSTSTTARHFTSPQSALTMATTARADCPSSTLQR